MNLQSLSNLELSTESPNGFTNHFKDKHKLIWYEREGRTEVSCNKSIFYKEDGSAHIKRGEV